MEKELESENEEEDDENDDENEYESDEEDDNVLHKLNESFKSSQINESEMLRTKRLN